MNERGHGRASASWTVLSLLGLSLAVGPACDDGDRSRDPAEAGANAGGAAGTGGEGSIGRGTGGEGGVSLAVLGATALDRLTPREVEALCVEAERHVDLCVHVARSQVRVQPGQPAPPDAEATCEATAAQCHAVPDAGRTPVDCAGITLESIGACPVTVDEYLACADAFDAAVTCANAGHRVLAPEACRPLREKCPALGTFASEGAAIPCPVITPEEEPADTNDDVYGLDGCRPVPARVVVLGDSIAECVSAGVDPSQCGPRLVADALRAKYAPDLTFESHAHAGSRIQDLPGQAAEVGGGPGHLFVWVYSVGNDLIARDIDYPKWERDWQTVFDYFADLGRFPGGATFLLNTQYSPWDECDGSPIEKQLPEVNQRVFIDVAEARPDTVAVDQRPDWFGHGVYAGDSACPHCRADTTRWISVDGIHPNGAGYAHMAEKWAVAFERMLPPGCGED